MELSIRVLCHLRSTGESYSICVYATSADRHREACAPYTSGTAKLDITADTAALSAQRHLNPFRSFAKQSFKDVLRVSRPTSGTGPAAAAAAAKRHVDGPSRVSANVGATGPGGTAGFRGEVRCVGAFYADSGSAIAPCRMAYGLWGQTSQMAAYWGGHRQAGHPPSGRDGCGKLATSSWLFEPGSVLSRLSSLAQYR